MKVIELFNLISRGRELPNKIRYNGYIFEYDTNHKRYEAYFDEQIWTLRDFINVDDDLNNEVGIIEEHKIPEKLPYYSLEKIQKAKNKDEWRDKRISLLEERIDDYHNKINEIIDYLEEIE